MPQFHPQDVSQADAWRAVYEHKFQIAAELQPRRMCEIGLRAGYSAFMFLEACPNAHYLAIDNDGNEHGGVTGMIQHARRLLRDRDIAVMIYDSQRLKSLPGRFDFVHVDGDHSEGGTRHDLRLAWEALDPHSPRAAVLVDDYGLIPDVRRATDEFLREHPSARAYRLDEKQLLLCCSARGV